MALVWTPLVSGSGSRQPLLTAPIQAVYDAVTGNQKAILQYVNQAVTAAEAGLPEGERVELDIRGWTIPGYGSVGGQVASYVNQQWKAGNVKDLVTGEKALAWPEYPTQVAWYSASNDTVVLRWRKGQPFVVWFLLVIVIGLGVLFVLSKIAPGWFGGGGYDYTLYKAAASQVGGTPPPTPTGMPLWEKGLLIGGGLLVAGGIVWFYAQLRLREAGANKSFQEIVIER
jgi:hypothetical protein